MHYTVLSNRTYLKTIQRTPLIALRTTVPDDTDNIIVDIKNLELPENIESLLALRRPRYTKHDPEPEEYTTHSEVLALFGSNPPVIVNEVNIVEIPEDFVGTFEVPKDTDHLYTDKCPGLVGLSGAVLGVNHIRLNYTSITEFNAPDSVTWLDMNNNRQLIKVNGNNIKTLYLINAGFIEFNALNSVTYLDMSNNPQLVKLTLGPDLKSLILNNTGFVEFNAPDSVTWLDMSDNYQLVKLTIGPNLKELALDNTGVTNVTGGTPDMVVYGLTQTAHTNTLTGQIEIPTHTANLTKITGTITVPSPTTSPTPDDLTTLTNVRIIERIGTKILVIEQL